jgi:hypothetical protein
MTTAMAVGDVATLDCDGDLHRSVDVAAPGGGVALEMTGDNFALVLISCSDPTPTVYEIDPGLAGHPTTHWASLPAGSYTMLPAPAPAGSYTMPPAPAPAGSYTMLPAPAPASITLEAKFSGALVSETCASAGTVSLDPTENTYVDVPPGIVDGWMHLAGGGSSYDVSQTGLYWKNITTAGPLSICTDCSGTSCVPIPIPFGPPTRVTISDQSVVRFQNVHVTPLPSSNLPRPWSSSPVWGQLMFFPTSG